ncbi:hypothetical protein VTO73DRAFT_7636 [Trametes versicolor]
MVSLPQILGIPPLDGNLGAVLLGVILGSIYFKLYPEDRLFLKSLVLIILVFETVHTAVWMIVIYHFAITCAFDPIKIAQGHCFYARRVFLLGSQYWWLAIPAIVTMLVGFGFGVGALVFVLQKSRINSSKRMGPVVDILIVYTVNTGLLTSIVSVIAFIFALIISGNLIYAAVSIVGAKYNFSSPKSRILTAFLSLNSRRSIDDRFLVDDFSIMEGRATGSHSGRPPLRSRGDCESIVFNTPQPYSFTSETSTMQNQDPTFAPGSERVTSTGV